jgi:hypothetical protein
MRRREKRERKLCSDTLSLLLCVCLFICRVLIFERAPFKASTQKKNGKGINSKKE